MTEVKYEMHEGMRDWLNTMRFNVFICTYIYKIVVVLHIHTYIHVQMHIYISKVHMSNEIVTSFQKFNKSKIGFTVRSNGLCLQSLNEFALYKSLTCERNNKVSLIKAITPFRVTFIIA